MRCASLEPTKDTRQFLQTTNHFELISPKMMSNPPSSLQSRQKLHRRQQSIPVSFEAMKVPQLLPTIQPQQNLHKRGQSFDVSRSPIQWHHSKTGSTVSTTTNIGPAHGQQILREAQQQRIAGPGQPPSQYRMMLTPHNIPFQSMQEMQYKMAMDAMVQIPQNTVPHPQFHDMRTTMSAASQGSFNFNENGQQYFTGSPVLPAHMNMMNSFDRRMSQPSLRIETGLRSCVSMQPEDLSLYPLTPAATPLESQSGVFPRSLLPAPQWQNQEQEIISPRPVSIQKTRSLQGIAEHEEISFGDISSVPAESAQTMSKADLEPTKKKNSAQLKMASASSDQHDTKSLFGEIADEIPKLHDDSQSQFRTAPSSPNRPALSPRRIEIADLNLDPGINASIEETNISLDEIAQYIEGPDPLDNKYVCKFEDCDKRFGRKENIKSHIQTHLGDRQFRCDHCFKRFVRGHDLKRHAKIHTGKKSYQCACGNAFARHDALTRHRQRGMCIGAFDGVVRKEVKRGRPRKHRPDMDDRLNKSSRTRSTKHQQLYSQAHMDIYASSASSCSISSWGSPPTEPMDHLSIHGVNEPSPAHLSPYDDAINLFGLSGTDMAMHGSSRGGMVHPMNLQDMFGFTPPASPGYSCGNKPSPTYRELTPTELASLDSSQPHSRFDSNPTTDVNDSANLQDARTGQSSQMTLPPHISPTQMHTQLALPTSDSFSMSASLPALSHSSSPPPQSANDSTAASNSLVFDFNADDNPLRVSTMSGMSGIDFTMSLSKVPLPEFEDDSQLSGIHPKNDFDSFLDMDDSQISLGMNVSDEAFFQI